MGEQMNPNLSSRAFEEAVEAFFSFMGYNTKINTVLHTRPVRIHAEIHQPSGKQRLLIECKYCGQEPIGIHEVEKFCSAIAFAREKSQADRGILITQVQFSEEAKSWCAKNCSFVELRTYRQLICKSIRFKKMLKKFCNSF